MVEILATAGLLNWMHRGMLVLMLAMLTLGIPATWLARRKAVLAGGPLLLAALRPRARKGWIVFLTLFSLMVVFNWLGYFLRISPQHGHVFLANQTILLFGAIACLQMGLHGWYVELREAGIVDIAQFSSWADIRQFKWVGQPAVLLLWYRRRGIVQYRLAAEQREAVARLLQAHLGATLDPAEPATGT